MLKMGGMRNKCEEKELLVSFYISRFVSYNATIVLFRFNTYCLVSFLLYTLENNPKANRLRRRTEKEIVEARMILSTVVWDKFGSLSFSFDKRGEVDVDMDIISARG